MQLDQLAHELSSGTDPVDVHEPGEAWKPMRHRDAERAKTKLAKAKRNRRHWKTKMWKRRTALRQKRIAAIERLAQRVICAQVGGATSFGELRAHSR